MITASPPTRACQATEPIRAARPTWIGSRYHQKTFLSSQIWWLTWVSEASTQDRTESFITGCFLRCSQRSATMNMPTPAQASARRYKDHSRSRIAQCKNSQVIKAAMPTSLTSRQNIVARKLCWLRRTSFSNASALIVTFAPASWDCQAFCISSKFIVCSFQLIRQLFADAVQLHADIVLRNAEHLGHLLITQAVEVHKRERGVHLGQLADGGVKPLHNLLFRQRIQMTRVRFRRHLKLQKPLMSLPPPPLHASPGQCGVEGHTINPGRLFSLAAKGPDG